MSWLFSQALVEECWRAASSAGESFVQLSAMPTAQLFWRNDKPMEFSRFSRFGLTLNLLTADRGEELLTWFLEDFLVRTSPLPAQDSESRVSAADYGSTWSESFAKYDPLTQKWRTRQHSLFGSFTEFYGTWPNWGLMRDGECWEQPTLELHTCESVSGLLPTPTTIDAGSRFNRSPSDRATLRPTLGTMARFNLWPTPTATMHKGWSRDHNRADSDDRLDYTVEREANSHGSRGRLNPLWVEWLMGWPLGWSELAPLEMAKFREWLQQHGGSFAPETVIRSL